MLKGLGLGIERPGLVLKILALTTSLHSVFTSTPMTPPLFSPEPNF